MFARVLSATPVGIDAVVVSVEVQVSSGLPSTRIVGLADPVTRESRERVLAAISSAGFSCPQQKVVVSLAPADVKKVGSSMDLPIALSLLLAYGGIARKRDEDILVLGELSLGGEVRGVSGVLVMADAARRQGLQRVMVPVANAREAALVDGIEVIAITTLSEAVRHLAGDEPLAPFVDASPMAGAAPPAAPDFRDVEGQMLARRALEIVAAGGHNLLMVGPPGVGKTMLAQRIPGILPKLDFEEAIEVTKIHSVAGLLRAGEGMVRARPFRSPHHTISAAGLVGGGPRLRPGDASLAHRGVLFLDEFSEFPRYVLELLRQPLEDRRVHLARAARGESFPASFILVASMNPCPCGFRGSAHRPCGCTPPMLRRHWQKLSGPLYDRIDLVLEVPPVPVKVIARGDGGESSAAIRARVEAARSRQRQRYRRTGILVNAELTAPLLRRMSLLETAARDALERAAEARHLSARAYHRVVKVARTIADLDGREAIAPRHVAEAMAFRISEHELLGEEASVFQAVPESPMAAAMDHRSPSEYP